VGGAGSDEEAGAPARSPPEDAFNRNRSGSMMQDVSFAARRISISMERSLSKSINTVKKLRGDGRPATTPHGTSILYDDDEVERIIDIDEGVEYVAEPDYTQLIPGMIQALAAQGGAAPQPGPAGVAAARGSAGAPAAAPAGAAAPAAAAALPVPPPLAEARGLTAGSGAPAAAGAAVPTPPTTQPATAAQLSAIQEHQGRMRGTFALGAPSRAWAVNIIGHPFAFCVTTTQSNKPFLVCAPNDAARSEWVRVLNHNIRVRQKWEQQKMLWKATMAAAAVMSGTAAPGTTR
jgi:hypothetical protein